MSWQVTSTSPSSYHVLIKEIASGGVSILHLCTVSMLTNASQRVHKAINHFEDFDFKEEISSSHFPVCHIFPLLFYLFVIHFWVYSLSISFGKSLWQASKRRVDKSRKTHKNSLSCQRIPNGLIQSVCLSLMSVFHSHLIFSFRKNIWKIRTTMKVGKMETAHQKNVTIFWIVYHTLAYEIRERGVDKSVSKFMQSSDLKWIILPLLRIFVRLSHFFEITESINHIVI